MPVGNFKEIDRQGDYVGIGRLRSKNAQLDRRCPPADRRDWGHNINHLIQKLSPINWCSEERKRTYAVSPGTLGVLRQRRPNHFPFKKRPRQKKTKKQKQKKKNKNKKKKQLAYSTITKLWLKTYDCK